MAPLFSKVDSNKLWHDVQHEGNVIYAQLGEDLFNISKVIGRKKVAQFSLTHSVVEKADENLFNSISYNPSHLLHQLLPRRTESSYSLQSRPHNFELSHIHDDRNFIDHMLFHPYHNV